MLQAAPPLTTHSQTSTTSTMSSHLSGQTPTPTPTPVPHATEPTQEDTNQSRSYFKGPQTAFHHVPAYVTDELIKVRDMLHSIEDEQMTMIDQLEVCCS